MRVGLVAGLGTMVLTSVSWASAQPVEGADEVPLPELRTWRLEATPFGGVMVDDPNVVQVTDGITSRVYVHNRFAVGFEGLQVHRFVLEDTTADPRMRDKRLALGLHLSSVALSGRFGPAADPHVADLYVLGGGGIISNARRPVEPARGHLDFTEMANVGLGTRLLFASWIGVTAEGRGNVIFDGGLEAPTAAFEGRLGLTTMWPPRRLSRIEL